MYFPTDKLAIEVDKKRRKDRDEHKEVERQKSIERELDFEFIRTHPDEKDIDANIHISKIRNHIIESTKKLTKKSLIDKISKRLSQLEFKSDLVIKSKALKCVVKKYYHYYKTCKLIV